MTEIMHSGSYTEQGKENKKFIVDWVKFSALSEEFADKMTSVAALGIDSFRQVEINFLSEYPQAMKEDKSLAALLGLKDYELEESINTKLYKIFHSRPEDLNSELRAFMTDVYYYFVMIKEEKSEKIQGFITFMSGGSVPKNEYKITILAVEENVRRSGIGSILINSLNKIGVKYKKILASTRPSNKIAIKAYKNWEFIEDLEAQKNTSSHFIKGHWIHLARYETANSGQSHYKK